MDNDREYIPPDLDSDLQLAIETFEEKIELAWADPEYGKNIVDLARQLAHLFMSASANLAVATSTDGWEGLSGGLKNLGIHDEVLDAIQIEIANTYATETRSMAERCLALAQKAITAKPRPQVAKFLQRVSRCYVVGFIPECIIVCRAVLENAVTETFDRHGIPLPRDESNRSDMNVRLDAAKKFGWIDDDARKDARDVWTRGNQNVHRDPDAAKDAADTIAKVMRVLDQLYA